MIAFDKCLKILAQSVSGMFEHWEKNRFLTFKIFIQ